VPSTAESFTDEERARLAPYFTNTDRHVFALVNLPETVKGALFARYSRSAKSLRRLFLDEFADRMDPPPPGGGSEAGLDRAEKLYARVFNEYGDDSVAQLGGAHIACEYVSNILTKVLEWGRLMAYLEQSTRYVPYTDRLHDRWRYHVPAELEDAALRDRYIQVMDEAFERYAKWIPAMQVYFEGRYPKGASDSDAVHRAAIRAKALDTLRGMLPAATQSNVGIYGSGQACEALLLRMRAHPLAEVRTCADEMLDELRKVIPAFLTRVDQPERGGAWSDYFASNRTAMEQLAARLTT
jgi:thymidylate synthase ThyX